jgi:hypothetical protein
MSGSGGGVVSIDCARSPLAVPELLPLDEQPEAETRRSPVASTDTVIAASRVIAARSR